MPVLPGSSPPASGRALTVAVSLVVAVLVVVAGDRLPGYHRLDGPLLHQFATGRGVHLGDVVVLAACVAVAARAVIRS